MADSGNDGMVERRVIVTYAGPGLPLVRESDEDGDTVPETRTVYTYDQQDRIVVSESTDLDQELLLWRYTSEYEGRLQMVEGDNEGAAGPGSPGADGTIDILIVWERDEEMRYVRHDEDLEADGTADVRETWAYLDDRNEYQLDRAIDGVLEQSRVDHLDAAGRILRTVETFPEAPGSVTTNIYDDDGYLIRKEYDFQIDDDLDEVYTYENDDDGHRLREEAMVPDSQFPSGYIKTWEYDPAGNVTIREHDDLRDGIRDSRTELGYECFE